MNCLVTGGAGFIGSNLAKKLVELDYSVVIMDDLSSGKIENIRDILKYVEFYQDSITNYSNVAQIIAFNKINVIFHLAAIPRVQYSIENPYETNIVNSIGTMNMLQAAVAFNVERFIFSSSSSVYGNQDRLPFTEDMALNPMSPYALQKAFGEHYSNYMNLSKGLKTVNLRYFNVFGKGQDPYSDYATLIPKFYDLLSKNKIPIINGDGEQTRDFTHVNNVVDANIFFGLCYDGNFGETFNIGMGDPLSVNKITSKLIDITGSNVKPKYGPEVIEPKHTYADMTKTNKTGFKNKINFEEGLKRTF